MNESLKDFSIFNTSNPEVINPRTKATLPFPLENIDIQLANAYEEVAKILTKIQASSANPVNDTPARKRKLEAILYKGNTVLKMLKEISLNVDTLGV